MEFSRQSELNTILAFILTSQALIIPSEMDIFLDFFQGAFGQFANFPQVF